MNNTLHTFTLPGTTKKIHNICYQKVNVTSRDFNLWSVFTLVSSKAFMELLYTVLSLTQWWDWILHFLIWLRDKVNSLNWLTVYAFALHQPRSQGSLLTFPTEPVSRRVGERTWERSWPWPSFMNHPYTCLLASNCLSQHAVPGRTHLTFEKDGWILNSVIKEALEPPHKNGALYIHFKIQFLSINIVRFHFAKTFKKGVDHKRGEEWPSEEV